MAIQIRSDMYCSRCREELHIVEMHSNEQEDGTLLCDICTSLQNYGYFSVIGEDGSIVVATDSIQ